jgi:hypothetical protein
VTSAVGPDPLIPPFVVGGAIGAADEPPRGVELPEALGDTAEVGPDPLIAPFVVAGPVGVAGEPPPAVGLLEALGDICEVGAMPLPSPVEVGESDGPAGEPPPAELVDVTPGRFASPVETACSWSAGVPTAAAAATARTPVAASVMIRVVSM